MGRAASRSRASPFNPWAWVVSTRPCTWTHQFCALLSQNFQFSQRGSLLLRPFPDFCLETGDLEIQVVDLGFCIRKRVVLGSI